MPFKDYLSAAWKGSYQYGGAIAVGGGSAITDYATDINPLLEITPSPWVAPIYGFATLNPMEAGRRFRYAVTGTGKFAYDGAWGYKTLMTGVKKGSLWANLSIGNVALSGIEATGKGLGNLLGVADDPTIKMMSQARTKGLAGMFGKVDHLPGGKHYAEVLSQNEMNSIRDKMSRRWKGRRHITGKGGYQQAVKNAMRAAAQGRGSKIKAATGLTSLMYWLGGESASGGKAIINVGAKGMRGFLGRMAAGLSGVGTALLVYDVTTAFTGSPLKAVTEGVTDVATALLSWQREVVMPDFGTGRIPNALQSAAAGTERRRAIQASYSAKINPSNRMFGNEARYHHSR